MIRHKIGTQSDCKSQKWGSSPWYLPAVLQLHVTIKHNQVQPRHGRIYISTMWQVYGGYGTFSSVLPHFTSTKPSWIKTNKNVDKGEVSLCTLLSSVMVGWQPGHPCNPLATTTLHLLTRLELRLTFNTLRYWALPQSILSYNQHLAIRIPTLQLPEYTPFPPLITRIPTLPTIHYQNPHHTHHSLTESPPTHHSIPESPPYPPFITRIPTLPTHSLSEIGICD